jgi:hypothetical protein
MLKATSVENGLIRSCRSESSLRYDGGIKSYKESFYLELYISITALKIKVA